MKKLQKFVIDKEAKSKKTIGLIITIIVIGVVVFSFFNGSLNAVWGLIVGAVVLAVVAVGVYFLLKLVDDVPEALN
jgi:hypothetical protein